MCIRDRQHPQQDAASVPLHLLYLHQPDARLYPTSRTSRPLIPGLCFTVGPSRFLPEVVQCFDNAEAAAGMLLVDDGAMVIRTFWPTPGVRSTNSSGRRTREPTAKAALVRGAYPQAPRARSGEVGQDPCPVSYTHLRAHETDSYLV